MRKTAIVTLAIAYLSLFCGCDNFKEKASTVSSAIQEVSGSVVSASKSISRAVRNIKSSFRGRR